MTPCVNTKTALLLVLLAISLIQRGALAQEAITLSVPNSNPYNYFEDGQFKGLGVEKVKEIAALMGLEYKFQSVPNYGRALLHASNGKSHGFSLASKNAKRDRAAVLSDPIITIRWSWFLIKGSHLDPADKEFKKAARIASYMHANTHSWLKKNDYKNITALTSLNMLPKLLLTKNRIDAVFVADSNFKTAINNRA